MAISSPLKKIRLWPQTLGLGLAWVAIALHWRPLIYNFDGYMYPLEGLDPLDTMNAHHLFWIPVQALCDALAKRLAVEPHAFCQSAGILLSGVFLTVIFIFTARLSGSRRWSAVSVLFLALSPQYWFLTMQNLPYIPFFLFMALAVWACLYYSQTRGAWWMAGAVAALAMAVQFQQAAVLLFFPLAFFFLWSEWRGGAIAWPRLLGWFALSLLLVCGPYLLIAHLMGIESVSEFRLWVTDYLESQHGLQYHWINLVQTVIGILRCIVHSDAFESGLIRGLTYTQIATIYSVIGVLALAGFFKLLPRLRPVPRYRRLHALCLGFMAAWSCFLFSWEPLMAHFWCLNLMLGLTCLAMAFPHWSRDFRRRVAASLLIISAWNAYANVHQDAVEQMRNPDAWMAKIHENVGPRDIVLFFARNRIQHVDYDLLAQQLSRERPEAIKILLPDDAAPADLRHDLDAARRNGGGVWFSSWILDPASYRDVAGKHDIFSPYPMKNLRDLDGPAIFQTAGRLLASYAPHPSSLVIGRDHFLKID